MGLARQLNPTLCMTSNNTAAACSPGLLPCYMRSCQGYTYLRSAAVPWGRILRVATLITVVPFSTATWRAGPLTPVVMAVIVPVASVVPVPAAAAAPVVPAAAPVITFPVIAFPVPAAAPLTLTVSAAAPLCCCYLSAARPATIRQWPTSQAIFPLLDDLSICLPDLLPAQVLLACQVVLQDTTQQQSSHQNSSKHAAAKHADSAARRQTGRDTVRDERVARALPAPNHKRDPPQMANRVPSTPGSMPYPALNRLTAECAFDPN
jgi:hypothetical protein